MKDNKAKRRTKNTAEESRFNHCLPDPFGEPDVKGKMKELIGYMMRTSKYLADDPVNQATFSQKDRYAVEIHIDLLLGTLLDTLKDDRNPLENAMKLSPEEQRIFYFGKHNGRLGTQYEPGQKAQYIDEKINELFDTLGKYCRLVAKVSQ